MSAEFAALKSDNDALHMDARRLAWATARSTKAAAERSTTGRVATLKKDEAFRRMPHDHHVAVFAEILAEELRNRHRSAGVARARVEAKVGDVAQRLRAYIEKRRRDVTLSFPDALRGFDGPAMVQFEILRETLRPQVERLTAAELLDCYSAALVSKSPRALIEVSLIEQRCRRSGISAKADDLPVVKQLNDLIDGFQDLRVEPAAELRQIAEVVELAQKAISRAELVQVRPIDEKRDEEAKAAFEAEQPEYQLALEEAAAEAAGQ